VIVIDGGTPSADELAAIAAVLLMPQDVTERDARPVRSAWSIAAREPDLDIADVRARIHASR
jgi:hypothetical protein